MRPAGYFSSLAAAGALLLNAGALQAFAQERTFPTITIIVGFAPGGGDEGRGVARNSAGRLQPQPGYDQTARLFARHIGQFLPGQPSVVLRHLPGAGSQKAASYLAHDAPRDGSVLAVISSAALIAPLVGGVADYTPASFAFIGGRSADEYVCIADGQTGIEDISGLSPNSLVFGSTAPGRRPHLHSRLLLELTRTHLRIVSGYRDTNELLLALRRGEITGICGIAFESVRANLNAWMMSGRLKPLLRFAPRESNVLRAVPRAEVFARDQNAGLQLTAMSSFLGEEGALAWTLSAPAAVPAERLALLRQAFEAMQEDRGYLREAARRNLHIGTVKAERIDAALAYLQDIAGTIRAGLKKLNDSSE